MLSLLYKVVENRKPTLRILVYPIMTMSENQFLQVGTVNDSPDFPSNLVTGMGMWYTGVNET